MSSPTVGTTGHVGPPTRSARCSTPTFSSIRSSTARRRTRCRSPRSAAAPTPWSATRSRTSTSTSAAPPSSSAAAPSSSPSTRRMPSSLQRPWPPARSPRTTSTPRARARSRSRRRPSSARSTRRTRSGRSPGSRTNAACKVHMDGARFANAVASLGCTPADLTWRAGVDVLSLGGTKNGMPFCEAVVFFDGTLADEFARRRKQGGQLASKMRFLAAPWIAMLEGGAWLRHATHANAMARRLRDAIVGLPGVSLIAPVAGQRRLRAPAEGRDRGPAGEGMALLRVRRRHRLPLHVRLGHDARGGRWLRRRHP